MKRYLGLLIFFASTTLSASCPQFASQYMHCESTSNSFGIKNITVTVREPFYKIRFSNGSRSWRMNFVTDGSPRDITIQTQDGSEATYIETASCAYNQLTVLRSSEEDSKVEETIFTPYEDKLEVKFLVDGALKNTTRCRKH